MDDALKILEEHKEEMDDKDLERIVDVITTFNLNQETRDKIKTHLEITEKERKYHPGLGRGKNKKIKIKRRCSK